MPEPCLRCGAPMRTFKEISGGAALDAALERISHCPECGVVSWYWTHPDGSKAGGQTFPPRRRLIEPEALELVEYSGPRSTCPDCGVEKRTLHLHRCRFAKALMRQTR